MSVILTNLEPTTFSTQALTGAVTANETQELFPRKTSTKGWLAQTSRAPESKSGTSANPTTSSPSSTKGAATSKTSSARPCPTAAARSAVGGVEKLESLDGDNTAWSNDNTRDWYQAIVDQNQTAALEATHMLTSLDTLPEDGFGNGRQAEFRGDLGPFQRCLEKGGKAGRYALDSIASGSPGFGY